jgi:hypothetical protein
MSEYFVGLYRAVNDERAHVCVRILHRNLPYEVADKKTGLLNTRLGFKEVNHGFITEVGNLFAMYDEMEALVCPECNQETDDPDMIYQIGHCFNCDDSRIQENG